LEKKANQNHQKIPMIMKGSNKNNRTILHLLFFYRVETHVKTSPERAPVRESIHSEAVLNIYPVDASTLLSASQDRVGYIFVYLIISIIVYIDISFV
jgi:hypothetical protein